MPTKPTSRYAPRTNVGISGSTPSVSSTFIDVDKLAESEVTKLTIRLPKALHKTLKAAAVDQEVTVQDFVRSAISQKLADQRAGES